MAATAATSRADLSAWLGTNGFQHYYTNDKARVDSYVLWIKEENGTALESLKVLQASCNNVANLKFTICAQKPHQTCIDAEVTFKKDEATSRTKDVVSQQPRTLMDAVLTSPALPGILANQYRNIFNLPSSSSQPWIAQTAIRSIRESLNRQTDHKS